MAMHVLTRDHTAAYSPQRVELHSPATVCLVPEVPGVPCPPAIYAVTQGEVWIHGYTRPDLQTPASSSSIRYHHRGSKRIRFGRGRIMT